MHSLLEFHELDCLDSIEHILGISPVKSSSCEESGSVYEYGSSNLIYETYEWAWNDNHRDVVPSIFGRP